MTGAIHLNGDKHFNCDSIVSDVTPERRWLSYPGGRLCVNPAGQKDFALAPTPADLALDLGGYVGTKVIRLPRVLHLGLVDLAGSNRPVELAARQRTIWHPYKLEFDADYADGTRLTGYDFFTSSQSTMIRVLEFKESKRRVLRLAGEAPDGTQVRYDQDNQSLLVSGNKFFYALHFVRLTGKSLSPRALDVRPVVEGLKWTMDLPMASGVTRYGISFGFATKSEGGQAAARRATEALARPVNSSLSKAKAAFDRFLRRVPAPTQWKIQDAPAPGVAPEMLRRTYYMAWTFLYQSLMDPLPENPGYPYPQMSLGKGALWAEGERSSPATCSWESLLGIQWLSFIEPETAWRAYEGVMSRVDKQGRLGGESLPSRKAQTAWILFQQQPDKKRLAAVYPAIKRYLLWREKNPRWIFGDHDAKDEKDMEFVVSWLLDVRYAARIADALGRKDEAEMWRGKAGPMLANMRQWFFSDPRKIHQYYFASRGTYTTPNRDEVRPIMVLTGLSVPEMPADMVGRLKDLFARVYQPAADCGGFNYLKYPDNDLVAYGLIDHAMPRARSFIEAVLRDCVRSGEFAEVLEARDGRELKVGGVKPSLFNALNVIEFTWLLNGVRYDSGRALPCSLPSERPAKP